MNSNNINQSELATALKAIDKVSNNVSKLEWNYERLKAKREKLLLLAVVSYWKSIALKDDFLYSIRLNYSSYEYDCGMLNENLTKELLSLDGVNSDGNLEIRKKRKGEVKRILNLQESITDLHRKAISLSVFYRSFVSQSRYQSLLSQSPDVQIPLSPVVTDQSDQSPSSEPRLQRKKSVHKISVMSPAEFEEARRTATVKEMPSEPKKEDIRVTKSMEKKPTVKSVEVKPVSEPIEKIPVMQKVVESAKKPVEQVPVSKQRKGESIHVKMAPSEDKFDMSEDEKLLDETLNDTINPSGDERMEEEKESSSEDEKMEEDQESSSEDERMDEEMDERSRPDITEVDANDSLSDIKSDFMPKYQWLRQGNQLHLMLMDVDFDQKSLRCVTRPTKPTPTLLIQGYRVEKDENPKGYYGMFYNNRPSYRYVPFTTVIRLPSVEVNVAKAPRALYYDDQKVLQISYDVKPSRSESKYNAKPKRSANVDEKTPGGYPMKSKKQGEEREKGNKRRSPESRVEGREEKPASYTIRNPFYPDQECVSDPRVSEYDNNMPDNTFYRRPNYESPYMRNRPDRNFDRSPFGSPFYPFFGGNMW